MTLERALAHPRRPEGDRFTRWMYRIMHDLWTEEWRASLRWRQPLRPTGGQRSPALGAGGRQQTAVRLGDIARALASLPHQQREAVLLVMVEGFSRRDAAEIADCPVAILDTRLVSGRDALLARLEDAR